MGQRLIEITVAQEGTTAQRAIMATPVGDDFAIHQRTNNRKTTRPDWAVTHLPTGRVIFHCRTKEKARAAAWQLQPLCDWANVGPESFATFTEPTRCAIRRVYQRYGCGASPARQRPPAG